MSFTGDGGVLRNAVEETSLEMSKILIAFGGYINSGDLTANHYAAVMNVGIGNSVRQKIGLQQVVVSGDVPGQWNQVKEWAVYYALMTFYRNAFGRVENDRYEKRYTLYKDQISRKIYPTLQALGIPMVVRPLSRPAALFERNSGTWDSTNVALVSGSGTLTNSTSLDVVVTYVDMSQANFYVSAAIPNNCESNPSDVITQQMATSEVLHVDITSLVPPTGAQHPSQQMLVVVSPLKATHWNVYVGLTGKTLYLQNSSPIPIATKTYTLSGNPTFSGYQSGLGQYADRRLSLSNMRQRA